MGEVHDLELFLQSKLGELNEKADPGAVSEIQTKIWAEYERQFQVRWGIQVRCDLGTIQPVCDTDAEKLECLLETDNRIAMFDPRSLGRFIK